LGAVAVGAQDKDLFLTLANRLLRLDKQLTETEQVKFAELSGGKNIHKKFQLKPMFLPSKSLNSEKLESGSLLELGS